MPTDQDFYDLLNEFEAFRQTTNAALAAIRNPYVGAPVVGQRRPDSPSGLTASDAATSVLLSWNAIASDLRRYELQNSTDSAFSDPTTVSTTQAFYSFYGTGSTSYYIRVRSVDAAANPSSWSNAIQVTLTETGGLLTVASVTTSDLAAGAATSLHSATYIGGFTEQLYSERAGPTTDTWYTTDVGSALSVVVVDSNCIIIPRTIVQAMYACDYSPSGAGPYRNDIEITLQRKRTTEAWAAAVDVDAAIIDLFTTLTSYPRSEFPGFTTYDQPLLGSSEAGVSFDYRIKFVSTSSGGTGGLLYIDCLFGDIEMEFLQLKR